MSILTSLSNFDFSDPVVLGATGIAFGGVAMLVNTLVSVAQRIKSTALVLFGTAGAGGASLLNEDVRQKILALLGLG